MNKPKINKQRAVELRQQGMSYKNIALELGCSVPWCAKELGNIEKGNGCAIDGTKLQAIAILEEALARVRAL